jgi:hypothetical protein
MNKVFFLVWLTFNPNHTANLSYMGGHEYGTGAACNAVADTFNRLAEKLMIELPEEEFPEQEYACTTFDATNTSRVDVWDIEYIADETNFFIKSP